MYEKAAHAADGGEQMSKQTDNYAALVAALRLRYDTVNNVIYGVWNGYTMTIYAIDARYPYWLTIQTAAKHPYGAILSKEDTKAFTKSVKPVNSCLQDGNHVRITINFAMGGKAALDKLTAAVSEGLSSFTAFLYQKGFIPCCSMCGMQKMVSPYWSEGKYYHLCPECETSMRQTLATSSKPPRQENVIAGIVGALLGSLLGVLCIVILSQAGYVAALSRVIMAVGVLKGYELLGGRLTKKGIVISIIIMLGMTYVGDRLDWAIALHRKAGGAELGLNLFECYRMVPQAVSGGVIELRAYIGNMALIYIFLLLGAVPTIYGKIKEKQQKGFLIKIGSASVYDNATMQKDLR